MSSYFNERIRRNKEQGLVTSCFGKEMSGG
jgi:hypothetical protein